jgi:hypothetical protein
MGHWQFIAKNDGGVAIYNPLARRFLGPLDQSGTAGCQTKEYQEASVFYGYKNHMDEKFRIMMPPGLFRTLMSAKNEGTGWGFQRDFLSPWFGFFDADRTRWMSGKDAKRNHKVEGFNKRKPGGWEKWKLSMHGPVDDKMFAFKSFHGKYLRCKSDGSIVNDTTEVHRSEKFILYQVKTNKIKIFHPDTNRYVRLDDDGRIHCNEPLASKATSWSSPVYGV